MRPPFALFALLTACLGSTVPPDAAYDADAGVDAALRAPRVVDWRVVDHGGRPWPADAAPRRPIVEIDFNRPIDPTAVFFFGPDAQDLAALEDDLARSPLRVVNERARLPVESFAVGATLRLIPAALEPGASYAVGVGRWAAAADGSHLAAPFVAALTIAGHEAGAGITDAWPPSGAAGIPTGLQFAAVRFDDVVTPATGVRLEGPEGVVRTEAETTDCGLIGWPPGTCVRLTWEGRLEPRRRYRLVVDEAVTDRGGAPVGPWTSTFETGAEPITEVGLLALACGLDEVAQGPLCLWIDDRSISLRALAGAPVRAFLEAGARRSGAVAPRGEITLRLDGLTPDADHSLRLVLEGPSGATFVEALDVHTEPILPPVTITEVRADARGPEPRQEYVELLNSGAVPVPLEGWSLSDRVDREGDVLGAVTPLPPGGRALLVASSFDPEHPDDPPVPEGIPLLRIEGSLGSGGLANAGEPLYLRDAAGRRVSFVPAMPAPGPGICWVRRDTARTGAPSDFYAAPCTPGEDTPPP